MQFSSIPAYPALQQRLRREVQSGRVAHTQLFYGPSNSNAFALAMAYVQYLLCLEPTDQDSCGQCGPCKQMASLNYPDLHFSFPVSTNEKVKSAATSDAFSAEWRALISESQHLTQERLIDALHLEKKKLNISVHEARLILERMKLRSYSGQYRIQLIYLAEHMNQESANKLLKLIEEPGDKTLILLISEEIDQILPTITSRCQKTFVPKATADELRSFILSLSKGTGNELDELIASADGSFGKAHSLLQGGGELSQYNSLLQEWIQACQSARVQKIQAVVDDISAKGREWQKQFVQHGLSKLLHNSPHPLARLSESAKNYTYQIFEDAHRDIDRNGYGKTIWLQTSLQLSNALRMK